MHSTVCKPLDHQKTVASKRGRTAYILSGCRRPGNTVYSGFKKKQQQEGRRLPFTTEGSGVDYTPGCFFAHSSFRRSVWWFTINEVGNSFYCLRLKCCACIAFFPIVACSSCPHAGLLFLVPSAVPYLHSTSHRVLFMSIVFWPHRQRGQVGGALLELVQRGQFLFCLRTAALRPVCDKEQSSCLPEDCWCVMTSRGCVARPALERSRGPRTKISTFYCSTVALSAMVTYRLA